MLKFKDPRELSPDAIEALRQFKTLSQEEKLEVVTEALDLLVERGVLVGLPDGSYTKWPNTPST